MIYCLSKLTRCGSVGRVRGLGPWGRRFESCHLDQIKTKVLIRNSGLFLFAEKPCNMGTFGIFSFMDKFHCGITRNKKAGTNATAMLYLFHTETLLFKRCIWLCKRCIKFTKRCILQK